MSAKRGEARRRADCAMTLGVLTAAALSILLAGPPVAAGLHVGSREEPAPPVRVWESTMTLPTYEEGPPNPNPPFDFFRDRRFSYPYTLRDHLTSRCSPKVWRTLNLENEYLRCVVLPDLGGHLYTCWDKRNGASLFYANPSIKLTQIAYRGAWAALGVEFNFPVSHNWVTTSPVDYALKSHPDGSGSVWVGNIDRPYGMKWRVELRLRPARAALEQHTTLYNRSDFRHRFYWWTNAAVEVWDTSRILYPMRFTAGHGFRDIDTWPVDSRGTDLSVVGNHRYGPVSRFSHGSREPYMGVYHPRTRSGLVHYSDPSDLPAKKIWSWGSDADGLDWRRALSDNESAYVEIQAGLFRDQETYGLLEPQEVVAFSEVWIPLLDVGGVTRANPDAVIHLLRRRKAQGGNELVLKVNVTRSLPEARLTLRSEGAVIEQRQVELSPETTLEMTYDDVPDAACTLEIRDKAGRLILQHTEGVYDFTREEEIRLGPQPKREFPPVEQRTEGDFEVLGEIQEREGRRLEAMKTYREGLARFPKRLGLQRAAGRLAVTLKQVDAAIGYLRGVLNEVSNDREASYYLGLAYAARGETRKARTLWERAGRYGTFRPAAMFHLAALDAREGRLDKALARLERLTEEQPRAVRAGAVQVALLARLGKRDEARERNRRWQELDPTSLMLRYEATRLGVKDAALWTHLAADPERILELAVDFTRFGLYEEALELLSRDWPKGPRVVSEPGTPRPEAYPLLAYYRGWAKERLGLGGGEDFDRASSGRTRYVFPNRFETFQVLAKALEHNPQDATAHLLLGSLYLSGGMVSRAMEHWETARRLNPRLPVLHRNMGMTVLRSGGEAEKAIALFEEGLEVDPTNVELYFGIDEAMARAGRSAAERADAMLRYPLRRTMPPALVYRLARRLAEAERFDEAERLFQGRFFPRKEGGTNVREVYLEVRLGRARHLARSGRCPETRDILEHLAEPRRGLAFTRDGLEPFLRSEKLQRLIRDVTESCPAPER